MSQSKRHSLIEVILNISSGMLISFTLSQLAHVYAEEIRTYVWSGFVWNLSAESNLVMTCVITVASFIRSYVWRRIFNRIQRSNYK